ncbi:excitatory amino acid transporter 3-like [Halichoeres trimaculatus]|uniref:excitatory amino acid transporter 3-like n=1 Tax=Halichoeres trimaculatus TaxID=147232 RepID=UPI003D9F62FD
MAREASGSDISFDLAYSSITAVVFGMVIGLLLKSTFTLTALQFELLALAGELVLQMFQCLAVPVLFANVLSGVVTLSSQTTGHLLSYSMVYFGVTNLLAVVTGWAFMKWIMLNDAYAEMEHEAGNDDLGSFSLFGTLLELVINILLPNSLRACIQKTQLELIEITGDDPDDPDVDVTDHYVDGPNILGLFMWAIFLGVHLIRMGVNTGFIAQNISVVNKITKKSSSWVRCLMPFGIMAMIATTIVEGQDWERFFLLGKVTVVIVAGLLFHGAVTLPLLHFVVTWQNPFSVIKGVSPALFSAFVMSSSSATMPQTLHCCEERLRLDRAVTRSVVPLGTSINMNGTALYEVVAALFITQLNRLQLDASQTVTILVTAGLSSVGASGIPATGAVTTIFVLSAVGVSTKEVAILVAVEWILDRFNTVMNVLGDCIGVALIDALMLEDLARTGTEEQVEPRTDGAENGEENETQV